MIISGTCAACRHYGNGMCGKDGSPFQGRSVWGLACVSCDGYRRSNVQATPVPAEALSAAMRG